MTKRCTKCGETKLLDDFSPDRRKGDGRVTHCRPCHASYGKPWHERNREKVLERQERYRDEQKEKVRESQRRWRASNPERNEDYRRRNPEKTWAHRQVQIAVKAGQLIPAPCEECGSNDLVHAHHDDYGRPLDVRWLCPACHVFLHRLAA